MPDNSKPSGTTSIVQNKDPWSGQQPYLTAGFERSKSFLDQPKQFYPGSTVVPFSPQTEQALSLTEQRATTGSPFMQTAGSMLQDTAGGSYLDAGNPYFQNAIEAASRPLVQNYQDVVAPGINSAFSQAGRYGSGAHTAATGRAAEGFGRSLADMAGSMAYQNYSGERGRQLQAGAMAPTFAAGDYADIGQLANVGGTREAQAKSQLQEDINRFMFAQQAPRDALSEYMAQVAGGQYGGQSTTQQPIYSNPLMTGLGAGATAAGIGGSLFGGGGIWPGALKGIFG